MKKTDTDTLLAQWEPPADAGEALGCFVSTFTFDPMFFEEQCLRRFLRMQNLPEMSNIAYILEREEQLGPVTISVLVDRTYSGVDHSMRWDVLPVHIPGGVQHSKICILAWSNLIRIIVSSANVTRFGYRVSREIVSVFDYNRNQFDESIHDDCLDFAEALFGFTSHTDESPALIRSREFLAKVRNLLAEWKTTATVIDSPIDAYFVSTLPQNENKPLPSSSLETVMERCKKNGGAPFSVYVLSPFFDQQTSRSETDLVAVLVKKMGRGKNRTFSLCVAGITPSEGAVRLYAPQFLFTSIQQHFDTFTIWMLPFLDCDRNKRPWHAKMMSFENDTYSSLFVGSSNFTKAGLGVGSTWNAEANVLYMLRGSTDSRMLKKLFASWPVDSIKITKQDEAEWLGNYSNGELEVPENQDENNKPSVPLGFEFVVYHGGSEPQIALHLNKRKLPSDWEIRFGDDFSKLLYDSSTFERDETPENKLLLWIEESAPGALQVRWDGKSALWPVNVDDPTQLPLPKELHTLTTADLLRYLSAVNPSRSLRKYKLVDSDIEADTAILPELDPLHRYDLAATFLHRVRRHARLFDSIRQRLEAPAWSERALLWRLKGALSVKQAATRLCADVANADSRPEEQLLMLADFLLMLSEVQYTQTDGSISEEQFNSIFLAFKLEITNLAEEVRAKVKLPSDLRVFWDQVIKKVRRS